jgi:spore maturation protein A
MVFQRLSTIYCLFRHFIYNLAIIFVHIHHTGGDFMALAWMWTGMVGLSVLCGILTGRMDAVGSAALEGAAAAVDLCVGMLGGICLWMGVMELMERCGLAAGLARLFRPFLRRLLPHSASDEDTLSALSANVSANLLGLGNAATPLGIRAARRMAAGCGGTASDELCRLVVLNTASIQLLPTTVASVRAACGSTAPLDILPAVWLSSVLSVSAGLTAARLLQAVWRD